METIAAVPPPSLTNESRPAPSASTGRTRKSFPDEPTASSASALAPAMTPLPPPFTPERLPTRTAPAMPRDEHSRGLLLTSTASVPGKSCGPSSARLLWSILSVPFAVPASGVETTSPVRSWRCTTPALTVSVFVGSALEGSTASVARLLVTATLPE